MPSCNATLHNSILSKIERLVQKDLSDTTTPFLSERKRESEGIQKNGRGEVAFVGRDKIGVCIEKFTIPTHVEDLFL